MQSLWPGIDSESRREGQNLSAFSRICFYFLSLSLSLMMMRHAHILAHRVWHSHFAETWTFFLGSSQNPPRRAQSRSLIPAKLRRWGLTWNLPKAQIMSGIWIFWAELKMGLCIRIIVLCMRYTLYRLYLTRYLSWILPMWFPSLSSFHHFIISSRYWHHMSKIDQHNITSIRSKDP